MIITIDNTKFKVMFEHTNKEDVKGTSCTIKRISNYNNPEASREETLITTHTICNPKDNFEKEVGRQLSLKRALEHCGFSKPIRKIFWNAYKVWGKVRF